VAVDCVSQATIRCYNFVADYIEEVVAYAFSDPRDLCVNACFGRTCYNGGTCQQSGGIAVCLCRPGYTGPLCRNSK
jgi:EGF-like domain